jgi:hypothetical protein
MNLVLFDIQRIAGNVHGVVKSQECITDACGVDHLTATFTLNIWQHCSHRSLSPSALQAATHPPSCFTHVVVTSQRKGKRLNYPEGFKLNPVCVVQKARGQAGRVAVIMMVVGIS